MKIGFSLGRCIRDIVNGKVAYHDVYLIIAQTHFLDSKHLDGVIDEYMYRRDYLDGLDKDACLGIAYQLYEEGKIYQPRKEGHRARLISDDAVWMDLAPTITGDDQQSEQVVQAWQQYQLALKLTTLKKFPSDDHLR